MREEAGVEGGGEERGRDGDGRACASAAGGRGRGGKGRAGEGGLRWRVGSEKNPLKEREIKKKKKKKRGVRGWLSKNVISPKVEE